MSEGVGDVEGVSGRRGAGCCTEDVGYTAEESFAMMWGGMEV